MDKLPFEGLKFLILEDEFIIAMDLEQLCRDHGASDAIIFRSVEELGPEPLSEPFDAAIIDVMLGGNSTIDFAKELRAKQIPFVFATGFSASEEMLSGFSDVPVVGKPYSAADVIDAVKRAITR